MSAAVPEMLFLHCPDDVEPGLVVFLVTVLDGGGGAVDAVRAKGVLHEFAHFGALISPPPKGAILNVPTDLGVSKEGADFFGRFLSRFLRLEDRSARWEGEEG